MRLVTTYTGKTMLRSRTAIRHVGKSRTSIPLGRVRTGLLLICSLLLSRGVLESQTPNTWLPTNGPYGGNVTGIVVDPVNVNYVYCTTPYNGIYRSTNAGVQWASADIGTPFFNAHCIAAGTRLSAVVLYAGIGSYGIYKSTNRGDSWFAATSGVSTSGYFSAVVVEPNSITTVYVGATTGLYKTTDGGTTWIPRNAGLTSTDVRTVAITPSNTNIVYAGTTNGGIFKSTDAGLTWAASNSGIPTTTTVQSLAIDPVSSAILYAGTYSGVYRSTNSGGAWSATGMTTGAVLSLTITSSTTLYAATSGGGIYKTTNSGGAWVTVNSGLTNLYGGVLAVQPGSTTNLYAGMQTGDGLFKTTNSATTWSKSNTGINSTFITALASNISAIYAASSYNGIFRSIDYGTTWSSATSGIPLSTSVAEIGVDPGNPNTVYAATIDGVYRTVTGGVGSSAWILKNGSGSAVLTNTNVATVVVHPTNSSILFAGTSGAGIFRSVDYAETWASFNGAGLPSGTSIKAHAIASSNANIMYLGLVSGSSNLVYRTTNGGTSWVLALSLGSTTIRQIVIDPANTLNAYAGTTAGVYKTTNRGDAWSLSNQGLANVNVQDIVLNPNDPNTIYAATYWGTYRSIDAGASWSSFIPGLVNANAFMEHITFDARNPSYLYSGMYGAGVISIYLAPEIAGNSSLDFGTVAVNDSATRTYTLMNTGPASLVVGTTSVAGTHATQFKVISGGGSFTLKEKESRNVVLQFKPTSAGAKSAYLRIQSNAPNQNPFDVSLTGTGASPTIAVSTTSVDFGTVSVAGYAEQMVKITNAGSVPLVLSSQKISTGDSSQFLITHQAATTINAGGTDYITVRFQPTSVGIKSSALQINSNASNEPTKLIALTGTGMGTANITASLSSIDFGSVNVGASLERQLIVTNSGTATLTLSSQTISGTDASDFSITRLSATDIQPGRSDTVRILFRPGSTGGKSASLKIVSNATNQPTVSVNLAGTGTGVPLITVSTEDLDFGAVNVGGLAEQSVIVTNQGAAALNVLSQFVLGTDAMQFTITRLSANHLNPGQSDFITIRFAPTTGGSKEATMRIQTDANNRPQQDVVLRGIAGGVAAIEVGADTVDFGGVAISSSSQKSVTVKNNGAANLLISSQTLTTGDSVQFSIFKLSATTLTPGQTDSVIIRFFPTTSGYKQTALKIESNASNYPLVRTVLIGTGGGVANISSSSEQVVFGAVTVGGSASQSITISNSGTSVLNITSQTITGSGAASFTLTKLSKASLSPGESDNISILFQPTSTGTKGAQLSIVSNAANEPTKSISISGIGGSVAAISSSALSVDFGSIGAGSASEQSLTISNSGLASLTLSSQRITGGDSSQFTIVKSSVNTLSAGQSDIVTVRFQPTSIGNKTSTLRIMSNANNLPILDISLTGSASGAPVITLGAATLDFGSVDVGRDVTFSLAISNTGSADLVVEAEKIVGTDSSDFVLMEQSAPLLAAGQVDSAKIRFQPSQNGSRSARLLIISNDPNPLRDTVIVALVGMGVKDVVAPQINHTQVAGPVQIGATISVNATASDAMSGVASFELWYRTGSNPWSSANRVSFSSGVADIPGSFVTNEGIDYRIIAVDNAGNVDTFKVGSVTYVSIPVLVPALAGGAFLSTAGTNASQYKMFSVPLNLNDKRPVSVTATLGAYNPRLWRFFDYRSDGYHELPDFQYDTTRIVPGRAFFLITRNSTLIPNTDGITVGSIYGVTGNTTHIPGWQLQSGWNFVGNPFGFDVRKSSLRLGTGDTLKDVWYFDGSWVPGDTLKRFEGLALRVSSATSLKLVENAQGGFNKAPAGTNSLNRSMSSGEWQIRIVARTDQMEDKENYIGVRYGAQMEKDDFDLFEPPMLPGGVSLYFPHQEWHVNDIYSTDIRPPQAEGHTWEFVVKAGAGSNLELTFAGMESVPTTYEQYVIDFDRNSAYDLKQQKKISTDAGSGERRFRIVVGTKTYADEQHVKIDLVPKTFVLHQNYPNPFNPATTLQYELPVESSVTLRVFNTLGEEVRTLVQAQQSEGYYEVRFDAGQLPSGIYFAELRAMTKSGGVFRVERKLVLQK